MENDLKICDLCGEKTEWQKVAFRYPFRGKIYNVKNFPAEVCPSCDEKYFHGEDLEKLNERLLEREFSKELEFSF